MESRSKCNVPFDLRPILEALAREVLRSQPSDVAFFGHLFFDEYLRHRQENKNVLTDAAAYEVFRADLQKRFVETDRPPSPLDNAATKIQAVFKGHLVRAHPEKYGLNTRTSSSEKLESFDHKKDQKRHSVGGYTIESDTPEDRAATKIQSEIRGFLTRKHVEKLKKEDTNAATKIQAHIRGFLTRKHLEEQGISPSRSHSSLHSENSENIGT
uniref:RIIa domain-containing protein n=1 Tax=Caenorhabditis japonica TaxID=281687 RepID=A0A8R1IHF6_CAEJA